MDLLEKKIKFHEVTIVDKDQLDTFIEEMESLFDSGFFFTIRLTAYSRTMKLRNTNENKDNKEVEDSAGSSHNSGEDS